MVSLTDHWYMTEILLLLSTQHKTAVFLLEKEGTRACIIYLKDLFLGDTLGIYVWFLALLRQRLPGSL